MGRHHLVIAVYGWDASTPGLRRIAQCRLRDDVFSDRDANTLLWQDQYLLGLRVFAAGVRSFPDRQTGRAGPSFEVAVQVRRTGAATG
jgi:hypothetical protein